MVVGAFSSIIFNLMFADTFGALTPWLGLLVGMAIGGVFSLIHAVATITFRADQTVSGVAINMLALGATLFVVKLIYGKAQTDKITEPFYKGDIPLLSDIPIIGDIFFKDVYYTSILALVLAVVAWFVLFKMPFGLRLRAVGEHPMAADTMGIKVYRMRYIGVFISGLFGGLGGAVYASTIALDFSHATITGQGFIALAALVFGKWHPFGAMGAAYSLICTKLKHHWLSASAVSRYPERVHAHCTICADDPSSYWLHWTSRRTKSTWYPLFKRKTINKYHV